GRRRKGYHVASHLASSIGGTRGSPLLSPRSPIGAVVRRACRQRRTLDEEKQAAHRPSGYRRGPSLLPLGTVQPSESRSHCDLCCRSIFWRGLGASLAHPVPRWQRALSRTSRAGTELCLDRRRMHRLANLRRDSRAEHSFLACLSEFPMLGPARRIQVALPRGGRVE